MSTKEEEGGIVTTVREETTKDLDVLQRLKEEGGEPEKPKEDEPKPEDKKEEKTTKKAKEDEFDFNALPPAAQREMNRLYKELRAGNKTARQVAALEEKIAELETKSADKPAAAAPQVQSERPKKPNPVDYKTPEEFATAEAEYEDKLYDYRKAKERREAAEAEAAESDRKIINKYNEDAKEFEKTHEDYQEVLDTAMPMSNVMFGFCLEKGPQVAYYLASNPDEAAKIVKMKDPEAIEALIRIKIKLEDAPAKTTENKTTKKAEPPTPSGGKAKTEVVKDRSQMSFKERERELAKRNPGAFGYEP